jgi:hypothetical protein
MANLKTFDNERYADLVKTQRGKTNTLGPDSDDVSEGLGGCKTGILGEMWATTPILTDGLVEPNYSDYPGEGNAGTRYVQVRLHSYLPSGVTGPSSCQTFLTISSDPASHSPEDIEAVRLKHLISPSFSPNKSDASHEDPNFRGFQMALYPAQSNGGTGNDLVAYTTLGPISPTADPSAQYGVGDEFWYVDYDNGVVRLSVPPVTSATYQFNPNAVYADINGTEVESDAYGAITLFATFFVHDGSTGSDLFDSQFTTIGDGIISSGTFTGTSSNTFQSAVDFVGANGGGTIYVKDGYYDFNDGYVNVSEDIELRGHNNVFIKSAEQQTIFKILGSNSRIHNLSLEIASGAMDPCSAIEISGNTNAETIENILIDRNRIFVDGDAYGVLFYPEANDLTFRNIEISNNIFEDDTSGGWPGINEPSFIGLATPPLEPLANPPQGGDGTTYDSTFTSIEIQENIFRCTQTNAITMVADFATVDGLHIDGNKEVLDGNARINIRFSTNDNVRLTNNLMPASDVVLEAGVLAENRFLTESMRISPDVHSDNEFYGFSGLKSQGEGNLAVIVGEADTIWTSPDGISWTTRTSGISETLLTVSYNGKDLWVAVGTSGTIITSPDSVTWTARTSGTANDINSVAFDGKNLWVAAGVNGTILTSSDGIAWTTQTSGTANDLGGVLYNDKDLWVVVGAAGTILTSPDGITWTARTSGTAQLLTRNAYNDKDLWVVVGAAGTILTSPDGITWTARTSGTAQVLWGVAYNSRDLWVATGATGTILTSPDGITWTAQVSGVADRLTSVAYNGSDLWILVGDEGTILLSSDGVHWTMYAATTAGLTLSDVKFLFNTNAGLVATGADYNGAGVVAIGRGNDGIGVAAWGDGYGAGVKGVGGALGGPGVLGFGGDGYDSPGVVGYGGKISPGMTAHGGSGGNAGIESFGTGQFAIDYFNFS